MAIRKTNLFVTKFDSCIKLLMKNFNIVRSAYTLYENGKIHKNFDAVLRFDGGLDGNIKMIIKYYPIPVLGMDRMTKLEQHMFLKEMNINTPATYDICGGDRKDLEMIDNLLHSMPGDTHIILKPYLGAKGIGQVIMRRSEIYDKLYKIINGDKEIIDESHLENKNNERHHNYTKEQIGGDNYIIQVYEENIHKEYRILCFYENNPIIIERIKSCHTWQSNMGANPDNTARCIDKELSSVIGSKNAKTIFELFNKLNVPFLSIDIYMDKDKNMGIFEFQMEFAYDGIYPVDLLYKYINSSVNRMLIKMK